MKQNKGITLVALVITIIILIILAGITISLVLGENGLIGKSKQGAKDYKEAANNEQEMLGKINDIIDGEVPTGGSTGENPTTYPEYTVGQTVTVGGEEFYVLEDSDTAQSTVTLFAKYNLNKAGTAQAPDATKEDTNVPFSSNGYWKAAHQGDNNRLDLYANNGEVLGDAIYKAKTYAESLGGDNGRLLTNGEYNTLYSNNSDIVLGKANHQGNGNYYLYYWLGTVNVARGNSILWVMGWSTRISRFK